MTVIVIFQIFAHGPFPKSTILVIYIVGNLILQLLPSFHSFFVTGSPHSLFHLTQQVSLTAADVRNLQLAKAAVAGGIRVLLEQRHITADELESVEIAGGFGNYLKPESAVRIGMLPKGTLGKLRVMGNTALAGASMLALDGANWERLRSIPAKCRDIELSGRDDFADAFTDNLTF